MRASRAASSCRGLRVARVELLEQVELLALLAAATMRSLRMCSISLLDLGVLRVDVGALVDAGQEAGLPVLRLLDRVAAGAHGDEAGQVLVLAAQAVGDPRAEARPDLPRRRRSSSAAATARGSARRRASSG